MSKTKQSRIDEILSKRYVSYDKCIDGVHHWLVKGSKDNTYTVLHNHAKDTWSCQCPSFEYDEDHWIAECKHTCAVQQYVMHNNDIGYSEEDDEAIPQRF